MQRKIKRLYKKAENLNRKVQKSSNPITAFIYASILDKIHNKISVQLRRKELKNASL